MGATVPSLPDVFGAFEIVFGLGDDRPEIQGPSAEFAL
jgi:hypothetical protein